MMRTFAFSLALLVCVTGFAQQQNTNFAAMNFNAPASASVSSPVVVPSFTDSCVTTNIKAFPGALQPVVIICAGAIPSGGSFSFNTLNVLGFQLDIADVLQPGYDEQIIADGFTNPSPISVTDVTGNLTIEGVVPACVTVNNVTNCVNPSSFEFGLQAICIDPTAPFNLRSTAPGRVRFTKGYQEYSLSGNNSGIFNFLGGFTFKFYGKTYTRAWLSANGYVSFEPASTGFPSPSVGDIRSAEPRIMSFYNDLEPQVTTYGPRIYAQQFEDCDGTRKVKFVHERLQEFGNATGPHGGEVIITEAGEIAVLVAPYNTLPSINTGVGISPGNNVDTSSPPTTFGRDLVADTLAGPTTLGAGKLGFELFDHGVNPANNPMNFMIAFGFNNNNDVGPGVVYVQDPALQHTAPANSGYIIEPFMP